MDYNKEEDSLFSKWMEYLHVTEDEFVTDGLLYHYGLHFDGMSWVNSSSGNNSENWDNSDRRLLIITRDQPCDDGNIWDVRGETPYSRDGISLKRISMFKCLLPWSYAALHFEKDDKELLALSESSMIKFWMSAPIARMNCGKIAGNRVKDGGCPRSKVIEYLTESSQFILEQIKMYDANIIMCCTGYDTSSNPVVDFIKECYLPDLFKVNYYSWYSPSSKKIIIDSYHFSNRRRIKSNEDIDNETFYIKNSIFDTISKGFYI